ncbi:DKNYY domain-containing protein [Shewanella sp. AS16]|uniref:DKNYY domain-containing protein n=1 Tax=Shewanella sp. AS16 TaxID=2907625 RepID=UPI001F294559|nr:DKNYY domain-containing protein [Shewanella sp. AS16]MCE9688260.1 DKNYY domain-containing protein [Shewanella sp. AS16]
MKMFLNIVVTLFILFWPIVIMMSPMMFDAPGSEDSKSAVFGAVVFLSYPVGLFLLLGLFGVKYFGMNSFILALVSAVIIFFVFSVFGYSSMVVNLAKGISNGGYSVVGETVYYNAKPIVGADAGTFKAYKKEDYEYERTAPQYAADKDHFYYSGKRVEGVSLSNLEGRVIAYELYWLNDTQVVQGDKILEAANPLTFNGYDGFSGWTYSKAREGDTVYSYNVPLQSVDFASFKPLSDGLGKDKNQIFKRDKVILSAADPETFELLSSQEFARDKDHVYYMLTENPFAIDGADPETFAELGRNYLKDKNNIYYVEMYESVNRLEDADVNSFQVTAYDEKTESEAKDNKHYYFHGKILDYKK